MMARTYDPSKLTGFLAQQFLRYGALTAGELEQIQVRDDVVNVDHIVQAFNIALSKGGQKQPQVRVNGFVFKYATRGATPGAIFVIEADAGFDEYLGKIYQGKFMPVRGCTSEQQQRILAAASNPLEAIIAFGRQTGKCSICNRPLTDPASVQAGVGPICRAKYGL